MSEDPDRVDRERGRLSSELNEVAQVDLGAAALFGAAGGALVSVALAYRDLVAWQRSRSKALREHEKSIPIGKFFDPVADFLVLITRVGLGAVAGLIFHSEITGVSAAIAIGLSAPLLLAQLGRITRTDAMVTVSRKEETPSRDDVSRAADTTSKGAE